MAMHGSTAHLFCSSMVCMIPSQSPMQGTQQRGWCTACPLYAAKANHLQKLCMMCGVEIVHRKRSYSPKPDTRSSCAGAGTAHLLGLLGHRALEPAVGVEHHSGRDAQPRLLSAHSRCHPLKFAVEGVPTWHLRIVQPCGEWSVKAGSDREHMEQRATVWANEHGVYMQQ